MTKKVLLLATFAVLLVACSAPQIGGPTAPRKAADAGQLTLPSGRTLWVYPEELMYSGVARYQWPTSRSYDGEWNLGLPHGIGTELIESPAGQIRYHGQWRDGARHGHGELNAPNGDHYVGSFVKGVRHGEGTETTAKGLYRGFWADDVPHGLGEFSSSDGSKFRGQWVRGSRNGHGTFIDTRNNEYVGDWAADAPNGFGTFTSNAGAVYEGRWVDGARNGYGRLEEPSGLIYEGIWAANKRHGFGAEQRPDGSSYKGAWQFDKRHGQGIETQADGGYHDGAWENSVALGPGTRRQPSGIEISGAWNSDLVSTGLLTLPSGAEYAGPLFRKRNREADVKLINWLTRLTDDGYANYLLGTLYLDFEKPARNEDRARRLLSKATDAGIADAQFRLAILLLDEDANRALELLIEAAATGHARANELLGEYYHLGRFVQKDLTVAHDYYMKAAASGSLQARNNLAWLLATAPSEFLRDGKRAVATIRPIALLYGDWQHLDTLAAAYAEAGEFDAAVEAQRQALMATQSSDEAAPEELILQMRDRLDLFQRQVPFREP